MNLVAIAQLLSSLPFNTAKVERLFFRLKLIKTDRRTSLSQKTLSDLLEVSVEGTELENFDSSAAVQLWWSDCSRTRHESHPPKEKLNAAAAAARPSINNKTLQRSMRQLKQYVRQSSPYLWMIGTLGS